MLIKTLKKTYPNYTNEDLRLRKLKSTHLGSSQSHNHNVNVIGSVVSDLFWKIPLSQRPRPFLTSLLLLYPQAVWGLCQGSRLHSPSRPATHRPGGHSDLPEWHLLLHWVRPAYETHWTSQWGLASEDMSCSEPALRGCVLGPLTGRAGGASNGNISSTNFPSKPITAHFLK